MSSEKRKFTRFNFKMRSELFINEDVYQADEIINLSIGGCLLPVDVKAQPSDECLFKIMLGADENEPVILINGEIVRSESGITAVRFIKIDTESLEHLQRIARYNSSDPEKVEEEIREHPGLF